MAISISCGGDTNDGGDIGGGLDGDGSGSLNSTSGGGNVVVLVIVTVATKITGNEGSITMMLSGASKTGSHGGDDVSVEVMSVNQVVVTVVETLLKCSTFLYVFPPHIPPSAGQPLSRFLLSACLPD